MKKLFTFAFIMALALGVTFGLSDISIAQSGSKGSGAKKGSAKKGDPIKIGAIFASSGKASSLGLPEEQTAKMLEKEINAAGGINGRPLELIIYDTEGDETKAIQLTKKLIHKDKVVAMIGPTRSGPSLAILDTITKAEIPLVSCAASWKIVIDKDGNARKWIYKTPQSDSMAVEKVYGYFNEKKISKIAIMTVTNGFGASGREQLKKLAPNYKIEILADELFSDADVDMNAQLTKIKKTDAQAIVVWAVQAAPAVVTKNAKTLGMKQLIVQSHGVASKKFIELAGDASEGVILPAGKLLVVDQLADKDPQKKMLAEYKAKYEAAHGPVSTFGGHGYDAVMLVKLAIEKAGSDDPAKIRDALEQITGYVGTGGIFNMSPADHNGLTKDAFVMVEIKDGDWKLVK